MDSVHPDINPYEFLQVSVNSTMLDIRRAYRTMARKHHEDKGGDKAMMTAINLAYSFIMQEMTHLGDVTQHPKDIAKKFREFCDAQEAETPKFDEVNEDFHRAFEATHDTIAASLPGGYGEFMQPRSDVTDLERDAHGELQHTFTSVVPYEGVSETIEGLSQAMRVDGETFDNFSAATRTLTMADYSESFSPPVDSHGISDEDESDNLSDKLDARVRERTEQADATITWSLFGGLINSVGKRISNLFLDNRSS